MSRYFLNEIEIEGFRGINNENIPLKIQFNKDKITSIFAPNGLGKSSIFDALNIAIKGGISKFRKLQASENASDYLINKFHSANTAIISYKFENDIDNSIVSIKLSINSNDEITITSTDITDPNDFLENLDNDGVLTDYITFSDFLNNSALERGRTFSSLIGLSKLSKLKQAIDALAATRNINSDFNINTLKSEEQNIKDNINRQEHTFEQKLSELEIEKLDDFNNETYNDLFINLLRAESIIEPLIANKELQDVDFKKLHEKILETEGGSKRLEYSKSKLRYDKLITSKENLYDYSDYFKELLQLIQNRDEYAAKTLGENYFDFYTAAQEIYKSSDKTREKTCLLCDTTFENKSIHDDINLKLEDYTNYKSTIKSINDKLKDFPNKVSILKTESEIYDANECLLNKLLLEIKPSTLNSDSLKTISVSIRNIALKLNEVITHLKVEIETIEKELPNSLVELTKKVNTIKQVYGSKNEIISLKVQLNSTNRKLEQFDKWQNYITNLVTSIKDAEERLTTEILTDIESDTKQYFNKIMNNIEIKPSIALSNRNVGISLKLQDFFGQHDFNAIPVLSEAYKNAFAISVFLAGLKRQQSTSRFIVFDDITSSFDAGNQFRIMSLLFDEISTANNANGLQIIILSHDGLLRKYFKKQVEETRNQKWYNIELGGMPPKGNIVTNETDANHLKTEATNNLTSGNTDAAGNIIRQYLEFKLLEVIKKVSIPVPYDFAISNDKKMVSNCINAIKKAVALYDNAGTLILTTTQKDNLNNTLIPSIIGNWISHYETGSITSFNPHFLSSVLTTIDDFCDCFKYSSSGSLRYYRALDRR